MRSRVFRSLSLCVVVFPALGCELAAQETLELPQITVTAPRPIVRRRPAKPPTDAVTVAPAAPADIPLLGTLPIVTDQFATVTVVPTEEI